MARHLKRGAERRAAPGARPEAEGTAAAALRAPAGLRPLQRHQGALKPWRAGACRRPGPSAHRRGRQRRARFHRAAGTATARLAAEQRPASGACAACAPWPDARGRRLAAALATRRPALGRRRPARRAAAAPIERRAGARRQRRSLGAHAGATPHWPRWRSEHGCDLVLLAHHRRDQAETFLLQALRGAGPAGLAAMPRAGRARQASPGRGPGWRSRARRSRPMSGATGLRYVDDPSNDDTALRAQPPAARGVAGADRRLSRCRTTALGAGAARAQEAAGCLRRDGSHGPAGAAAPKQGIAAEPRGWRCPQPGVPTCCAHWLRPGPMRGVPDSLVGRLLAELPACREPRAGHRRRRVAAAPTAALGDAGRLDGATRRAGGVTCRSTCSRPGRVELPAWQGTFEMVAASAQGGLSPERLACMRTARTQRRRALPGGTARLAARLEEAVPGAGVPAWARAGPLLYAQRPAAVSCPGWASMRGARCAGPPSWACAGCLAA